MNDQHLLTGVVPVLLTPFGSDHSVDEASLTRLMEYLESKRVGGYWVLGTGGEDMSLSYRQRLQVAEIAAGYNDGRLPLVLGSSFFSISDSLQFFKDTEHLEFSAYHYMPYHTLIGLDNIETTYRLLATYAPRPLWMYTSANWSKSIPPDFIGRLSDHPNIGGIKFSTSNAVHIEKALTYQNPNFQVITAVVKQFYPSLTLGAQAGTTVEACLFPDEVRSIFENHKTGNQQAALLAQRTLNRKLEATITSAGRDNFLRVAEIKYALSLQGICEPFVSYPYRMLTSEDKEIINSALSP